MSKQQGNKSDVLSVKSLNLGKVLGKFVLEPKLFSSGKVGFYGYGPIVIPCNEKNYKFQVGINLIMIQNDKNFVSEEDKKFVLDSAPMLADQVVKGCVNGREFSTGSVGFYYNDKIKLEVNNDIKTFQLGVQITAHGSKEWSNGEKNNDVNKE